MAIDMMESNDNVQDATRSDACLESPHTSESTVNHTLMPSNMQRPKRKRFNMDSVQQESGLDVGLSSRAKRAAKRALIPLITTLKPVIKKKSKNRQQTAAPVTAVPEQQQSVDLVVQSSPSTAILLDHLETLSNELVAIDAIEPVVASNELPINSIEQSRKSVKKRGRPKKRIGKKASRPKKPKKPKPLSDSDGETLPNGPVEPSDEIAKQIVQPEKSLLLSDSAGDHLPTEAMVTEPDEPSGKIVKKKGRPKKSLSSVNVETLLNDSDEPSHKIAKKKGRPPKSLSNVNGETLPNDSDEPSRKIVKKKGRPPKSLPLSHLNKRNVSNSKKKRKPTPNTIQPMYTTRSRYKDSSLVNTIIPTEPNIEILSVEINNTPDTTQTLPNNTAPQSHVNSNTEWIHLQTTCQTSTPLQLFNRTLYLQNSSCTDMQLNHFACHSCHIQEPCVFYQFRAFDFSLGGSIVFLDNSYLQTQDSVQEERLDRSIHSSYVQDWISSSLLKILEKDVYLLKTLPEYPLSLGSLQWDQLMSPATCRHEYPRIYRRCFKDGSRQLCDACDTSLFNAYCMCRMCGREICFDCFDLLFIKNQVPGKGCQLQECHSSPHSFISWIRLYKIPIAELTAVLDQLESYSTSPPISNPVYMHSDYTPSLESPDLPSYECPQSISLPEFQMHWSRGMPVAIHNIQTSQDWSCDYFQHQFPTQALDLVDCFTGSIESECMSVEEYFSSFIKYPDPITRGKRGRPGKGCLPCLRPYKLKDWPSDGHFKDKLPLHYQDFHASIPFPEYHSMDGPLNLASYLPLNQNPPDLGPKMYVAHGMEYQCSKIGTTALHLDMADAVNLLVSTYGSSTSSVGAIWDIFPHSSLQVLRNYLSDTCKGRYKDDPIHDQVIYLSEAMLKDLWEKHKIRPWRLHQRPGTAIYVPAGCAHQVYNVKHCIKVACDFVSPEHVQACLQVMHDFQQLPSGHHRKQDLLQIKSILWYAWKYSQ